MHKCQVKEIELETTVIMMILSATITGITFTVETEKVTAVIAVTVGRGSK